MSKLRELTKLPYENRVDSIVTDEHYKERDDLIKSLLADPCLAHYDPTLRSFSSTDFSAKGMGFIVTQPSRGAASLSAMNQEIAGGRCEFLDEQSPARLQPVAFGSR